MCWQVDIITFGLDLNSLAYAKLSYAENQLPAVASYLMDRDDDISHNVITTIPLKWYLSRKKKEGT